jgi:hypothetical protein
MLYIHIHLGDAESNFWYPMKVVDSLKGLFNTIEDHLVCVKIVISYH